MENATPITSELLIENGFIPQKQTNPADESSTKEIIFFVKGEISVYHDGMGWRICHLGFNQPGDSGPIQTMEELLAGMKNLRLGIIM